METIRVQRTMHAPAERVFDILADHTGYSRFPGVRGATLVRPGKSEPNGLGAVRRIEVGPAWFEEEITAFDRPHRLEYRIIRSQPPVKHELGQLTVTPVGDAVEVVWTSKFEVKMPLLGHIATVLGSRQMTRQFTEALRLTEELAR